MLGTLLSRHFLQGDFAVGAPVTLAAIFDIGPVHIPLLTARALNFTGADFGEVSS